MNTTQPRETLMCIGGPLSTKRLSVPAGLQWFSLKGDAIEISDGAEPGDGIVAFESVDQVTDFSISGATDVSALIGAVPLYVRKQFVSGEKGIAEVFTYQAVSEP